MIIKKYFVEIYLIMLTYLYFPDIFLVDDCFLTLEYLLFELSMDVRMLTEKKKMSRVIGTLIVLVLGVI